MAQIGVVIEFINLSQKVHSAESSTWMETLT